MVKLVDVFYGILMSWDELGSLGYINSERAAQDPEDLSIVIFPYHQAINFERSVRDRLSKDYREHRDNEFYDQDDLSGYFGKYIYRAENSHSLVCFGVKFGEISFNGDAKQEDYPNLSKILIAKEKFDSIVANNSALKMFIEQNAAADLLFIPQWD